MAKTYSLVPAVLCAFIFTVLFHRQSIGLNLFLAESLIFWWMTLQKSINFKNHNHIIFGLGVLMTAIAVVVTNSYLAIFINLLAVFILSGILVYPDAKSIFNAILISFYNLYCAQSNFLCKFSKSGSGRKGAQRIGKAGIFILPLFIIAFFIWIYRSSNPFFDKIALSIATFVGTQLDFIFGRFDLSVIFTFLLALVISNFLFLGIPFDEVIKADQRATDELYRVKENRPRRFKLLALSNEQKAGVFLLVVLNAALLAMNSIDLYYVWFNFTWDGQYLKQFVHEGTYLLLLSIICSIAIVLYFFRGNLNFYSNNKILKFVSYIWLIQNAVLTLSVGMRNFWYIHYYALAYKRIALIIFLVLTLYGLYTVFIKVRDRKSSFYLFRSNGLALYVLLISSSLINWDIVIAQYNIAHADTSFLDLQYNSRLSDKALPCLDLSATDLMTIEKYQQVNLHYKDEFMKPAEFQRKINTRKKEFQNRWESQSWLSWNLSEHQAYEKLKDRRR